MVPLKPAMLQFVLLEDGITCDNLPKAINVAMQLRKTGLPYLINQNLRLTGEKKV